MQRSKIKRPALILKVTRRRFIERFGGCLPADSAVVMFGRNTEVTREQILYRIRKDKIHLMKENPLKI